MNITVQLQDIQTDYGKEHRCELCDAWAWAGHTLADCLKEFRDRIQALEAVVKTERNA